MEQPQASFLVPMVISKEGHYERAYDIYSRLLKDRIIILSTPIYDVIASNIIAQLLFLNSEDSNKDISLYINSPGGSVSAGLAIYDTMQFVKADVATYCMGVAASMGAVLLTAGTKGKRFMLPNAEAMIHQPWGGVQGQASDIKIQAEQILKARERLIGILSRHTGHSAEKIGVDADRDFWMTAEEAVKYGLVDKVVSKEE